MVGCAPSRRLYNLNDSIEGGGFKATSIRVQVGEIKLPYYNESKRLFGTPS